MWQDTVAKEPIFGLNYCDINFPVFKPETFFRNNFSNTVVFMV
jgi:hypothetical protein